MTTSATEWLTSFATELGIDAPSEAECGLAAKAGLGTTEARELAARMEQRDSKADPDAE